MIFGAILSKTELWLPSHTYSSGTFAHCDPEDLFTDYGFVLPTGPNALGLAEAIPGEYAYNTSDKLHLLTKDEKVKMVRKSHPAFLEVEVVKLKDTPRVFVGRGDTVTHTAAIATELFRTGHFKDVESFLKVHRKYFTTNVKYMKYDTVDILARLPEPVNLLEVVHSGVGPRNRFQQYREQLKN